MNRPLLPVIGLPRAMPTPRIVLQPELTRTPVLNCNTCRFERTPMPTAPCGTCRLANDDATTSKWQPK